MGGLIGNIRAWFFGPDLRGAAKWFLLSAAVGAVAGLGAIVFHLASQSVAHFVLERLTGYVAPEPAGELELFSHPALPLSPWWIVVVMTVGGLLTGLIVFTFAPETEGHGTDAVIDAFHQKQGFMRARTPLVKLVASAITIGTGGSAGREGPIAQIGAGFGSFLATQLKLTARERRVLLAAGMGAGIGSIFRAPLAGAIFAAEILYSEADLEADVIVPAAIASIVGFSVFSRALPGEVRFVPLFGDRLDYSMHSLWELIPLTILAAVLVAAAIVYIKCFYGTRDLFRKLPGPPHVRPAIGACLASLAGVALFLIMGSDVQALGVLATGYGALQVALTNPTELGITLLVAIALVKIVTTSLTIGSGGSGGVFGPSVVIGGCLSAALGVAFHRVWPELVPKPEVYAIVGMAGFFAGCAHAPISTIIMVSEITGDYKLLLPTMWVSTLCFLLCRRHKLYEKQVPTPRDSPAHRGEESECA